MASSSAEMIAEDVPSPSLPQNTVTIIIMDWDDTIFPITWLTENGMLSMSCISTIVFTDVSSEKRAQFEELQKNVIALLTYAMTLGTCIIITNAKKTWVEMTCQFFLPKVWQLMGGLRIVSARDSFERTMPQEQAKWKEFTFKQEILAIYGKNPEANMYNIISFGDSIYERSAIKKAGQLIETGKSMSIMFAKMDGIVIPKPCVIVKSIKFVDKPCIQKMTDQLNFMYTSFNNIVNFPRNLDIMLVIEDIISHK